MPKKVVKRSGNNDSLSAQNRISKMTGRSYSSIAFPTASDTTTISEANLLVTNIGDRAAAFGDMFMYWRMVRLRIRGFVKTGRYTLTTGYLSQALAESHSFALGFVPISNADFTAPTTNAMVVDYPEYKLGSGLHPLTLHVGRSGLIGSQIGKWLHTGTGADATFLSAGTVTTVLHSPIGDTAANASSLQILYEFDLEFKGPTDTNTLPMIREPKICRQVTNFAISRKFTYPSQDDSWDFAEVKDQKVARRK